MIPGASSNNAISEPLHIVIEDIISNANFELLCSQEDPVLAKMSERLSVLLSSNPQLISNMVQVGFEKDRLFCTIILAYMIPAYFDKNLSQHTFMASDFTWQIKTGKFKGISTLWYLAGAATKDKPEAIMRVLEQYPGKFKAEDFTAVVQEGPYKGRYSLRLLVDAAVKGKPEALLVVLSQIAFDSAMLKSISREKLPKRVLHLIECRYQLCTLLESKSATWQQLQIALTNAEHAGYVEAHFDVGKYFEQQGMFKETKKSFLNMSAKSLHHEDICSEYSAKFIGMATQNCNDAEKLLHLKTAIKFSLKIKNDDNRCTSLQTIARLYINHKLGNGTDVGSYIIPAHKLQAMHDGTESQWCLNEFDELAKMERLSQKLKTQEMEIKKIKEQLAKQMKKHDTFLMPVRDLLTNFKRKATLLDKRTSPIARHKPAIYFPISPIEREIKRQEDRLKLSKRLAKYVW